MHRQTTLRSCVRACAIGETHCESFRRNLASQKRLEAKRDLSVRTLQGEFCNSVEISSHPTFSQRLCKGVLIYQAGAGANLSVGEELGDITRSRDHIADLEKLPDESLEAPVSLSPSQSVLSPHQPSLSPFHLSRRRHSSISDIQLLPSAVRHQHSLMQASSETTIS